VLLNISKLNHQNQYVWLNISKQTINTFDWSMCEAWKLWMVGNSACPGTGGLLQWAFWAPKAWYSGLTLCPRTWTAAHFACWSSIHNHIWMHRPNALYILLLKGKLPYLKFSKVSSCVISLNSSSLKEANTFRSFTRISTALALSCLWHRQQIQQKKNNLDNDKGPRVA